MHKVAFWVALLIIMTGGGLAVSWFWLLPLARQDVISLALVGPMSQREGRAIVRAAELYLDTGEARRKLQGKRVKLLTYDDQNDDLLAREHAQEIVRENQVLFVLGHAYSSTSLAAGKIYKKAGIPAITGTATAGNVTRDNEWYFRTVPTNTIQAEFAANYIKNVLHETTVSIVAERSVYSTSLTEDFERAAAKLDLRIEQKRSLNPESKNFPGIIRKFLQQIQTSADPGVVFCPTSEAVATQVITAIPSAERRFTILGTDSFTSRRLLEQLRANSDEQDTPGYYSDGVYALTPLMFDVANEQARQFRAAYLERYGEPPSWEDACFYDAIAVAVEAIARSNLQGAGHIRSDRRKVRRALENFYAPDTAVQGITGEIYFDIQGNVRRPFAIAMFRQQRFVPAFTQFQSISDIETLENPFEASLRGEIALLDDQFVQQTQIVHTGVCIHKISRVDLKDSRYTIDFSLWFRYWGDLPPADMVFIDATDLRSLDESLYQPDKQATLAVYHFEADFKNEFDFHFYPFDIHFIPIRFRHAELTRDHLIYVPDRLQPPPCAAERPTQLLLLPHWHITDILHYQDTISHVSTLGIPRFFDEKHRITYSQYTMMARIKRDNLNIFIQQWSPTLLLLVLIYGMTLLPPDWFGVRIMVSLAALLTNVLYHHTFTADLPVEYMTPLEYAIFIVYGLIIVSLVITISAYAFYQRRLDLLRRIYLFQPLPDRVKAALSKKMRRHRFEKPGQIILQQGDRGDSLFVIIRGEVRVLVEGEAGEAVEVARLSAGHFVGEGVLLTGEPRSTTIVSATPVLLGEITRDHLTPVFKQFPELPETMRTMWKERLANRELETREQGDSPAAH